MDLGAAGDRRGVDAQQFVVGAGVLETEVGAAVHLPLRRRASIGVTNLDVGDLEYPRICGRIFELNRHKLQ